MKHIPLYSIWSHLFIANTHNLISSATLHTETIKTSVTIKTDPRWTRNVRRIDADGSH